MAERDKEIQRLKNELFGGPAGAYAAQKKPIHGIQANDRQDFMRQELEYEDLLRFFD